MTQPRSTERQSDPWSILTAGLRQMRRLDLDDIRRGVENFAHPSAAGLMDSLGRTRQERVEKMAELLCNSSEADIEELGTIFGLAMAKLAEERATGGDPATPADDDDLRNRPRRRRRQSAAEWRRERRLAS